MDKEQLMQQLAADEVAGVEARWRQGDLTELVRLVAGKVRKPEADVFAAAPESRLAVLKSGDFALLGPEEFEAADPETFAEEPVDLVGFLQEGLARRELVRARHAVENGGRIAEGPSSERARAMLAEKSRQVIDARLTAATERVPAAAEEWLVAANASPEVRKVAREALAAGDFGALDQVQVRSRIGRGPRGEEVRVTEVVPFNPLSEWRPGQHETVQPFSEVVRSIAETERARALFGPVEDLRPAMKLSTRTAMTTMGQPARKE